MKTSVDLVGPALWGVGRFAHGLARPSFASSDITDLHCKADMRFLPILFSAADPTDGSPGPRRLVKRMSISAEACRLPVPYSRGKVLEGDGAEQMIDSYVQVYQSLLDGRS